MAGKNNQKNSWKIPIFQTFKGNEKRSVRKHSKRRLIHLIEQNSSLHSVSRDLGISQHTLNKWVKKFKEKGFSIFGQEGDEVKKLQTKVKRLQDERNILKKASSFFAKHEV